LGLDKTAECFGFKSFPFWPDTPSLVDNVGAIGEFTISLTDEEEDRSENPFLEFDPVPYKPAFAAEGTEEGCSASNAACNNPTLLPCCHSVDIATFKTWYIDCVDDVCVKTTLVFRATKSIPVPRKGWSMRHRGRMLPVLR
jgi:hypothetical protein